MLPNHKNKIAQLWLLYVLLIPANLYAGSPFLTDDPQPVDYQHWELYLSSILDKSNLVLLEPNLWAPVLEFDWGILPNTQFHTVITYAWALPGKAPAANGIGDIETGIEYRFITETKSIPQVSFSPLLELPTGDASKNLGNGQLWAKIPIWMQKSWGSWTAYGGGGYALNSAKGMLNFFFSGWVLQKRLSDDLTIGTEIYYQEALSFNSSSSTILNVGGTYKMNNSISFLFSAGRNIAGQENIISYLGIYWTGTF